MTPSRIALAAPLRRALLTILTVVPAAPALADHAGPAGVGGGALTVIDPETLGQGDGALGFRLVYIRPDQRSDAALETLAGQHIHAHNSDFGTNAALGAAYGVTKHLTVSVEMPYVHRDDLREGEHSHSPGGTVNEVVDLGSVSGVGDLSLLAKLRLTGGESAHFALIGGLKMPTGSTHRRSDEGERFETEHQPGTGSWDPIVGAAFGAKLGAMRVNASALYQFSGKGAQDTRLGDRAQGGLAVSHRFGPAEHPHHGEDLHGDGDTEPDHYDHGHSSWDGFVELTGEWEGKQRVGGEVEQGSGGTVLWLTPGGRFTSASGLSASLGIGVPVWQDVRASHPNNSYRVTLSVGQAL